MDLGFALVELGAIDGDLGHGFIAGVEGGEVLLVGVVHGLLGEDAVLLHLEGTVVGAREHGEVGGLGGYLVEGNRGSGGVGTGDGGGELCLLGGDLVEDLFFVELGEDFAAAYGLVDVGVELGDNAAGLGFDLDFGNGLDLAGGDDGAGDVADVGCGQLGRIKGRRAAEGLGQEQAAAAQHADNEDEGDPKAFARF